MKTVKILITGRVQGVFFRLSTKKKAQDLGLKGHVKNLRDGRVEIVAQGDEEKISDLLGWAKEGPRQASVDEIDKKVIEKNKKYSQFSVKR